MSHRQKCFFCVCLRISLVDFTLIAFSNLRLDPNAVLHPVAFLLKFWEWAKKAPGCLHNPALQAELIREEGARTVRKGETLNADDTQERCLSLSDFCPLITGSCFKRSLSARQAVPTRAG
jgi:hypothetical protein